MACHLRPGNATSAADRILAAEPMEVPDVPGLLDELNALRERRA